METVQQNGRFTLFSSKFPSNIYSILYGFERRICAQTQDLQIFKKFYMCQMNPKEIPQHCILSSTTLHSGHSF